MKNSLLESRFSKTAYSKQLIYAKQLIRISFKKNNLFKTAYLWKNNLIGSLFQKLLNQNNLFMQNSLLGSLFIKNSLFKIAYLRKTTY